MNVFNQKVPAYLYSKSNLIRLVLFTALFALVFINIYKPFSSENWYKVSDSMFLVYSSLVILTGVLVVAGCRFLMFHYAKRHGITYWEYGLWILSEIFFMALFYTVYVLYIRDDVEFLTAFKYSITNTSLVLLLPYAIVILYFSWQEKGKQLQRMQDGQLEEAQQHSVFSFYDEKGELQLSVQRSDLLYIESADNYVVIWYLDKKSVSKFILRSSLKTLEPKLSAAHILRCHRSYLVNFDLVKIIRRRKDGVYLELGIENVPDIPISKTYSERVTQWIMNHTFENVKTSN